MDIPWLIVLAGCRQSARRLIGNEYESLRKLLANLIGSGKILNRPRADALAHTYLRTTFRG